MGMIGGGDGLIMKSIETFREKDPSKKRQRAQSLREDVRAFADHHRPRTEKNPANQRQAHFAQRYRQRRQGRDNKLLGR